ncbi:MAG: glycosyltransferase family 1 protein, partial [Cyanobacteria bacterium J083]
PLAIPYTVLTYGKEVWQTLPPSKQKALQTAEAIWTISRYSRERLCQSNNIPIDKVKILPCVVDENFFTPGEKPQHLLTRYNLHNAKVLMTVARLWSGDIYKGVDVTIRALPTIVQAVPEVKYLVIGRGDDRPRLEKLAQQLGVKERVIFAGFVPTEELKAHYQVADAYIMPSQEGFGIVYLEAMACGVPVLAGDADGSADPLQDGKLGWRVPHRDVEAVAQGCIAILQGYDRRCQGEWLRQETITKFSKSALVQELKLLVNF